MSQHLFSTLAVTVWLALDDFLSFTQADAYVASRDANIRQLQEKCEQLEELVSPTIFP